MRRVKARALTTTPRGQVFRFSSCCHCGCLPGKRKVHSQLQAVDTQDRLFDEQHSGELLVSCWIIFFGRLQQLFTGVRQPGVQKNLNPHSSGGLRLWLLGSPRLLRVPALRDRSGPGLSRRPLVGSPSAGPWSWPPAAAPAPHQLAHFTITPPRSVSLESGPLTKKMKDRVEHFQV